MCTIVTAQSYYGYLKWNLNMKQNCIYTLPNGRDLASTKQPAPAFAPPLPAPCSQAIIGMAG